MSSDFKDFKDKDPCSSGAQSPDIWAKKKRARRGVGSTEYEHRFEKKPEILETHQRRPQVVHSATYACFSSFFSFKS